MSIGDTKLKDLEKPILIVLLIAIIALVAFTAYETGHTASAAIPTVTPTPDAVAPVSSAPAGYWTGTLQVTGLTTGAGWPEAIVADGRAFQISYSDYDMMSANSWANFYVTGTFNPYGTTIYIAPTVSISYTDKPVIYYNGIHYVYYHSNGVYYRDDGHASVIVNRDEAIAHGRILEAVPPHYRR